MIHNATTIDRPDRLVARSAPPPVSIFAVGMSLGLLLAITFVVCVAFDLAFPGYAMNPAWAPLFPGFTWLSWSSFLVGLVESFAYGWYAALIFCPLFNFFAARCPKGGRP